MSNSQRIIIPRPVLKQVGIETDIELVIKDGAIILRPTNTHPASTSGLG
ncbi:AbrB/MazE/SpoVT family DNA-binding domain-containing protein [Spirosoma koreense]